MLLFFGGRRLHFKDNFLGQVCFIQSDPFVLFVFGKFLLGKMKVYEKCRVGVLGGKPKAFFSSLSSISAEYVAVTVYVGGVKTDWCSFTWGRSS